MLDIHVPSMSTYGPRYIPLKNLFAYLGKFPLGVSFQFFDKPFYMELSHPLSPHFLPRELNQMSFLGHITFSWFRVEMLLKKGFQLRTASTQQQSLILLNSNNQETHKTADTKSKNSRK